MQIMQSKLVEERLFDHLMGDQEAVGAHPSFADEKRARHVSINEHRAAVAAVAGEIRNVVAAVDTPEALTKCRNDFKHDLAGDVVAPVRDLSIDIADLFRTFHRIKTSSDLASLLVEHHLRDDSVG